MTTMQDPARDHRDVVPSDANELVGVRAIWVGSAGDIVIEAVGGGTVTYTVAAGTQLNVRARRVLATGTTAAAIVAWY